MEQLNINVYSLLKTCSYRQVAYTIAQAWLLGNKVVCTGDIYIPVHFDEDTRSLSLPDKLGLMLALYHNSPEHVAELLQMKKNWPELTKANNRPRGLIVRAEQVKRAILLYVEALRTEYLQKLEERGFVKIRQILEGDVLHVVASMADSYEGRDEYNLPVSGFFRYQPGDDYWPHAPYYFFLPVQIFDRETRDKVKTMAPKDIRLPKLTMLFLYRIPDILLLSVAEMEQLRLYLDVFLAPLRTLLQTLFAKTEAGEDVEQCHAWVVENLAVVLSPLRHAIHNHPLVQTLVQANPTLTYFDVCLDFAHYHEIYLFFKVLDEIPKETEAVLEQELKRPELKNAYRPFLTARDNWEGLPYEAALEDPDWVKGNAPLPPNPDEEMNHKRKTLDLL